MEKALSLVRQLVRDFKSQEDFYLSAEYQEQEARKDFIDKFLIALGWDVNHERQKNPYEQEVKIEQSVKTGKAQRRADYAFFIEPNFRDPKFFVEAKKPSKNLNEDDYHQINWYAYYNKIPISVLTDFQEFHIIDCRFKPNIATVKDRLIESFHYTDYADEEKFSRIFYLFGREAVANGSVEKRAAELPKLKGKIAKGVSKDELLSFDDAFLEKLDEYRKTLAKSFKKHNQELESEQLTEAVQRTIDRLVFIRFLEDKNIEEPRIENLPNESSAWKAFVSLCSSLEPKYNGLVFKRHSLIDDKSFSPPEDEFADICREFSNSFNYPFDQIPISILGSIYERFLGKVVHATPKRADVEEKPEVRKAGGVYYTPEYIVRYIVGNTVGKLIEGKTPEEISKMAFADIACGSGSFLIEVYSELLDYHTRYYIRHPEKAKKGDTQTRDGQVVLSLKKRQEILVNNIYGVDIDFQATEVTQLSLYLKLLEDVTMNDAHQFGLIKEKILPDLRKNIVCGNSLIGTDILEGDLFEKTEERKLNPMNFEDAFPEIMKRGGFDAIVGNPPWIDIKGMEPKVVDYYFKKYSTVENRMNVYSVFLQVALTLLKSSGLLGYITPSSFTTQSSYSKLRKLILSKYSFINLIRLPDNVFKN
ncbi:N-6 DNA methylase, partial [bacterium]|nr:N-6 DNA methylase [bacterium]